MTPIRRIFMGSVAALFGAALLAGEPAVNPARHAEADSWQERWGTEGITCEGCCGGPNTFCCSIEAKCKHVIE